MERDVANPPIPAACSPYFSSPGVLVGPPAEPEFPPQPQWDDAWAYDPDYDKRRAEYEAAMAVWQEQKDAYWRQIRQQAADYQRLMRQATDSGCREYVGWQPTHSVGSGETALSEWGGQKWSRSADDRNLVWAVLMDTRTKAPFLAVSMHLPNEKGAAAEKYRRSLARAVPTQLSAVRRDLGATVPTVLMGDLNSFTYRQPRGAQWLLGRAGFRDAYTAPKRINADASTVNVTTVRRDAFPARPVLSPRPARLDYVFLDRGRPLRYEVHLRLRNGRFDNRFRGSDHNLVLADARLGRGTLDGQWRPVT
jgi:endonuclease/exonuclease/phosphatase family metal-dependent hydrolase